MKKIEKKGKADIFNLMHDKRCHMWLNFNLVVIILITFAVKSSRLWNQNQRIPVDS